MNEKVSCQQLFITAVNLVIQLRLL